MNLQTASISLAMLTLTTSAMPLMASGSWEVAAAYTGYDQTAQLGSLIYIHSTSGNLFVYNPDDGTSRELSRLDGLTGSSVARIAGDDAHECMAIIYEDGDINLMYADGRLVDLPDLKNKTLNDKTINNARIVGDRLYISAGYGFSVIDLVSETFGDSYIFNENCIAAYDLNGALYMDTGSGLYTCPAGANAYDRTEWQLVDAADVPGVSLPDASSPEVPETMLMSGPAASELHSLNYLNGMLVGVYGSPKLWDEVDFTPGVVSLCDVESGTWSNYNRDNLRGELAPTHTYALEGLTSVALDPLHPGRYAVGNLYDGVLIMEGDSVVAHYTADNSPLEQYWKERVSAMAYDEDGTLWVGNPCQNSAALKALLPDGTWMSYPVSGFDGGRYLYVTDILATRNDPYRFKWVSKTVSGCIMYYDGATPGDLTDDEAVYFASLTDQDGNVITPERYNGFAEDNNGAVWILTSIGPFVSDSPIDTYNTKGTVRRIKIPRNDGTNLADYLLANVDTKCMVVDAANRKWIGTADNGLYLLSADGLTTIEHFTTDNSPLFSDEIISLAIDQEMGRIFISTSGGILTYTTDAVSGKADFSSVYCYPNPVRPEYTGDLCVTGLMDGSKVRITDVSNNVVFAATSAGGSITWDLCNRSGKRVKPGVYLIYGVDAEGKKGCVSKVLVVR